MDLCDASRHDHGMTQLPDDALADTISQRLHNLLAQRGCHSGVSLTEAARVIAEHSGCSWHALMRPLRTVAGALAESGLIDVIQEDTRVDIRDVRGPVRLRLRSPDAHMAAALIAPGRTAR